MKPTLVADEMFPEGGGNYGMELDEVGIFYTFFFIFFATISYLNGLLSFDFIFNCGI